MKYEDALAQADLGFKLTYPGFEGHITGTGLNGGKDEYVWKATEGDEYVTFKPSANDKKSEDWYTL